MKKIFSAFLLMTMMVFSVGSFVACSDLENEIAAVDKQATTNAEAIADLNSKLSTLQTALTAAQADADAAMDAAKAAAADAKKAQEAGDAAAAAAAKAQAEAEAAKAAAAQAKADAIAEATKQVEAIQDEISKINYAITNLNGASEAQAVEIEALQGEIAKLQTAAAEHVYAITNLTGQVDAHEVSIEALQVQVKAMEATLVKYGENLEALGLLTEDIKTAIAQNVEAIQNLSGRVDGIEAEFGAELDAVKAAISQNVGSIQNLKGQLEALEAQVDGELNTIRKELEGVTATIEEQISEAVAEAVKGLAASIDALKNRLQSVSYVPEWTAGPKAVKFAENKDNGYVLMSFEVAPKAYAEKITADNAKLVGVATKAVEPEEYAVKVLSKNAETGIVEVIGYIPTDAAVWNEANAALALRVKADDAQVTSAYQAVAVAAKELTINDAVYFGKEDEDGEFGKWVALLQTNAAKVFVPNTDFNVVMPYNTPVDKSATEIFKGLEARVCVEGFFDAVDLVKAAELLGIPAIKVETKASSYANDYFVVSNADAFDFVEDEDDEYDTPAFDVEAEEADSLDITFMFNEDVVEYFTKETEEGLKNYIGYSASVTLKEGFYRVNGKKAANFTDLTATYEVGGLVAEKAIDLKVAAQELNWNTAIASQTTITLKDVDVTGGNVRAILEEYLDSANNYFKELESEDEDAPTVWLKVDSKNDVDVIVKLKDGKWPEVATTYDYEFEGSYDVENEDGEPVKTPVTVTFSLTVSEGPTHIGDVEVSNQIIQIALNQNGAYITKEEDKGTTEVTINGVVDSLVNYYKAYFNTVAGAKDEVKKAANAANVEITLVDAEGELAADPVANTNITYTYVYSDTDSAEKSKITIPYDDYAKISKKDAAQYIQIAVPVVIKGVEAKAVVKAKVAKWEAGTAPTAKIVPGRLSPKFEGTRTFWSDNQKGGVVYVMWDHDDDPNTPDVVKVDPQTGNKVVDFSYTYYFPTANPTPYVYKTYEFDFNDYISFENLDDNTTYYVRWYVLPQKDITHTEEGTGAAKTYTVRPNLPKFTGNRDIFALKTSGEKAGKPDTLYYATSLASIKAGDWKLIWGNSDLNNLKINFELITADVNHPKDQPAIEGSGAQVKFETAHAIKSVTGSTVTIPWSSDPNVDMIDNIAKAITVTDLFDNTINNRSAEVTIPTFWDGYELDKDKTEDVVNNPNHTPIYKTATANELKIYGQTIKVVSFDHDNDGNSTTTTPTPEVWIQCTNGGFEFDQQPDANGLIVGDHFRFDTKIGHFKFTSDTKPVNGAEFKVKVEVNYMNDGGKAKSAWVTIKVQ